MDVVARINELCKERGISRYKLAKNSGLSQSSVSNMYQKGTIPKVETLEKICHGLDITLSQFFSDDGVYEDFTKEQTMLLDFYTKLEKNDKNLLMAYAMGLAKQK